MAVLAKADTYELPELPQMPERKRGRPMINRETKTANIRMHLIEWQHLKLLADEHNYSFSVMARVAIRKFIRENMLTGSIK